MPSPRIFDINIFLWVPTSIKARVTFVMGWSWKWLEPRSIPGDDTGIFFFSLHLFKMYSIYSMHRREARVSCLILVEWIRERERKIQPSIRWKELFGALPFCCCPRRSRVVSWKKMVDDRQCKYGSQSDYHHVWRSRQSRQFLWSLAVFCLVVCGRTTSMMTTCPVFAPLLYKEYRKSTIKYWPKYT